MDSRWQTQKKLNYSELNYYIDKKLQFRQHISNLCKKVSRQLGVLNRLKKLIPQDAKIKLYNSFLLSHLQYCSIIWHNCLKQDTDKLEEINKRALRVVYDDYHSTYNELLKKAGRTTLFSRRIQNIAIIIYKSVNNIAPQCVTELVKPKISRYELRDNN